MSVGFFLLVVVILVVLAVAGRLVLGYASGSDKRSEIRAAKADALFAKKKERIAVKALRSIVNNAGNPVLEAQIALDEIIALEDSNYTKELN